MIIGLCGFAGSGKGTVADILANQHYKKLSFADTLKDVTAVLFDWPRHLLEGDTQESRDFREKPDPYWSKKFGKDFTPRSALQKMGTEAGRDVFHKNLWVHTTEKQIKKYPRVVIADVRFPNEVDFIREQGGYLVRVRRGPEPEWFGTALDENWQSDDWKRRNGFHRINMREMYPQIHISEWAWIGTTFDFTIENDGPLHELEDKVNYMLRLFKISDTML